MQVKLTDKGRESLGLSADKRVVSVSDDRAFAMMKAGMANQDNTWMTMYRANNPKAEKAVKPAPEKTEAKAPEKADRKPPEKRAEKKEK